MKAFLSFLLLSLLALLPQTVKNADVVKLTEQLVLLGSGRLKLVEMGELLFSDLKNPPTEFMIDRLLRSKSALVQPLLCYSLSNFSDFKPSSTMINLLSGKVKHSLLNQLERRSQEVDGPLLIFEAVNRWFFEGLSEKEIQSTSERYLKPKAINNEYIEVPDVVSILKDIEKRMNKGVMFLFSRHLVTKSLPDFLVDLASNLDNKAVYEVFQSIAQDLISDFSQGVLYSFCKRSCPKGSKFSKLLRKNRPHFSKKFFFMLAVAKISKETIEHVAFRCGEPLSQKSIELMNEASESL